VSFCAALALVVTSCQPTPPPPAPAFPVGCDVGVLGDSLTVGTARYLPAELKKQGCTLAWADGVVSRTTAQGVLALQIRHSREELPAVLVVGLGTNDRYQQAAFAGHIDTIMGLAAGRPVVWVEIAHRPISANLNRILRTKAQQHRNLRVMDWNERYWAEPTWRATDDVHATPAGYLARAHLTAHAAQHVAK
jgi:lysophospholipase L1-like esterase